MGVTGVTAIKGRTVVSIAEGERLGVVTRVYVHQSDKRIVGFGVAPGTSWREPDRAYLIDTSQVASLGLDMLTIADRSVLRQDIDVSEDVVLTPVAEFLGRKVVTEGGTYVGSVATVDFAEQSRRITRIEVSPGFFKHNRMIQVDQVVNLGNEIVMVDDAVCAGPADDAQSSESEEHRMVIGDIEPTRAHAASGSSAGR